MNAAWSAFFFNNPTCYIPLSEHCGPNSFTKTPSLLNISVYYTYIFHGLSDYYLLTKFYDDYWFQFKPFISVKLWIKSFGLYYIHIKLSTAMYTVSKQWVCIHQWCVGDDDRKDNLHLYFLVVDRLTHFSFSEYPW